MVLGVIVVGVIYMAMNMTYVYALPLSEVAQARDHRARRGDRAVFSRGGIVAFRADRCLLLRRDGQLHHERRARLLRHGARWSFLQKMAQVHPKWRTPAFSLIGQGIWGAILTVSGRYDQLYTYVMFGMVLSYTMTVIGLFILRWKRPDIPRPYRCTGYPWLPAIYVLIGGAWTLNTIITRPMESLAGTVIVLIGVPGYLYWKRMSRKAALSS